MSIVGEAEVVAEFAAFGIRAFTTSRRSGSFGIGSDEPVREVMDRWARLRRETRPAAGRFATAAQVHGNRVVRHVHAWTGWLRSDDADGHLSPERGTAMAVTIADCVPVFLAHPSGAAAVLHAGWRGTAAGILDAGFEAFAALGCAASEVSAHMGPAICGACYEVSVDVQRQLLGRDAGRAAPVDLRAILAGQARSSGVRHVTASTSCTRCANDRFFSHRAGDVGRQVAVIVADT